MIRDRRRGDARFGQADVTADDHRLKAVDLDVRTASGTVADPDQAQDAERRIDRPPLLDYADEKIAAEERLRCTLRLDPRQESLEAAQTELLGGEPLFRRS